MKDIEIPDYPARRGLLLGMLLLAVLVLLWRIVDLQVLRKDFLQYQGDARHLRVVQVAAHRGMITDRHGETLAMSTPVDSVWANPKELSMDHQQQSALAKLLGVSTDQIQEKLASRGGREFVYLKRHVLPQLAHKVMQLGIRGVSLQREYRRYYPTSEVIGHVIGFTNIDDLGQEGIELAYNDWLKGTPGSKRVIKDRLGHIVENVESISASRPGRDLSLSIDRRLQYIAYRELKAAVQKHKARSASLVLLDVQSGEVLAMVNQPSFNPNNRKERNGNRFRNRSVTDVFEPGSTIKPFTILTALESGRYLPNTPVDTSPGTLKIGKNTVHDTRNYGRIDVSTVIQKSSNVGISKIALSLEGEQLWDMLSRVGFGSVTSSGFPGESSGRLSDYRNWHDIERATLSFGYGMSATALQLAQSYAVIASDGIRRQLSFIYSGENTVAEGQRVVDRQYARQVRKMLELAVGDEGTGSLARIPGYRVAGKTGTVRKSGVGGYQQDRYIAVFAGMAPASQPRMVMVVVINEPSNGEYYGGHVAAPVFSRVMFDALRLMNVPPDDLPPDNRQVILDGAQQTALNTIETQKLAGGMN